jgi:hypothetical protein
MIAWTTSWRAAPLEDRGPLAAQLVELMRGLTHRFAKATLLFLAEQSADPRLADALSSLHQKPPDAFSRPLVNRAFAQAMLVHADVRHVRLLEDLAEDAPRTRAKALQKQVRNLRNLPAHSASVLATLKTLTVGPARNRPKTVANQLWDAVYSNPLDLECRAVLADALSSVGDPLGEFIALQLRGNTEPPSAALSQRLLGPLRDLLKPESVAFANGFPVSGELLKLSTPRQQVALQCREWATFERIEGLARLSPQLRSLKSTSELPPRAVEEWVAKGWPIPLRSITLPLECAPLVPRLPAPVESVCFAVFFDDEQLDEAMELLAAAPNVKHLSFSEPTYRITGEEWPVWCDAARNLTSLETLTWYGSDADLSFVRGPRGFDTLRVTSKSGKRARVTMKHPATRIEHVT